MMNDSGVVRFHLLEPFVFSEKKKLKEAIASLMDTEGKRFESLDYIFCSDEYLLSINQSYLQHDELTDIITFDLSEEPSVIIGEIYISIERVKDNSLLFNTSFRDEFLRVVFHGALHLCGYKDKGKKEETEMRAKEDFYIMKFE